MMNIQQSNGDFSPNINGNNNRTNNFKVGFACKARYTFLGFILGIATSFLGSCLFDYYKNEKTSIGTKTENSVNNHSNPNDSNIIETSNNTISNGIEN